MKKNNKFRSNNNYNNNNHIFSLNYKFDSISSAGKISGTALDLIKRYNELAKEAQGNGDYIEAETFRQYAEHYRKIVTEINERKNQRQGREENIQANSAEVSSVSEKEQPVAEKEQVLEAENIKPETSSEQVLEASPQQETPVVRKRSFKVIEINAADAEKPVSQSSRPHSRGRKPRVEVAAL